MRFFARLWWLFAATLLLLGLGPGPGALAMGITGAYERVFLYYVYRTAVLTWGKDQDKFFPNDIEINGKTSTCKKGTHPMGGCNFVEFVEQLNQQLDAEGKPSFPRDVIDADLDLNNPDPHKGADMIRRGGPHTLMVNVRRLVPMTKWGESPWAWQDGVEYAMKVFKEGKFSFLAVLRPFKVLMPSPAHATKLSQGNIGQLDVIKKAMTTAIAEVEMLRQSDTAEYLAQAIQNKWTNAVTQVDEKPYTRDMKDPNMKVYSFNQAATFKKSPKKTFSMAQIKEFVKAYGLDDGSNLPDGPKKTAAIAAYNHRLVLDAWENGRSELKKLCVKK